MISNKASTIFVLLLLLIYPIIGSSQRVIPPQWIVNTPKASNSTYELKIFKINSSNIRDAKSKLPDEAAYYMERSFNVKGVAVQTDEISHVYENGKRKSVEIMNFTDTVYTQSDMIKVTLRVVDDYQCNNDVYFLCAIPNPDVRFVKYDKMTVTSKYGVKGLWRSAIVPGWGQLYKGAKVKGGLMLGGTVVLAGGIVYTECMRADYWKKQRNGYAKNTAQKQFYYKKEKGFATARNICIGGLCALYVYNLVDAVVAPGARYVKVSRTDRNGNVYTLAPSMNYDGSPMLAGSIRF